MNYMTRKQRITSSILSNPTIYILWFCTLLCTALLIQKIQGGTDVPTTWHMVLWIWITALLTTFADRVAYYNYSKPHKVAGHRLREHMVKKLSNPDLANDYQIVPSSTLIEGDMILLEVGDIIPHDGIIIKGISYINQTKITGELEAVLKYPTTRHNRVVSNSIVESDWIIVRITLSKHGSLLGQISKLLQVTVRQPAPSEVALQRILFGLSILFASITFSIKAIGHYAGINVEGIYMLDLLVTLLPTTISGLLYAISIHGFSLLNDCNIAVTDKRALDAAMDINVVIFDKTGTLTVGRREAVAFNSIGDATEEELALSAYLASIDDDTSEGSSILKLAKAKLRDFELEPEIDKTQYSNIPFSSARPISGCHYNKLNIYKGSVAAICKELGINEAHLPSEVTELRQNIASACGTPLLVARNNKILGIIHLQDRLRKNIKKHIDRIKQENIMTILMTGDGEPSALYVAKKLGIDAFYSDASAEDKLDFVRDMQLRGYCVAMYGDGVNDVPALAQADIGISFSYSNHHAIEASNIISLHHSLDAVVDVKKICRKMSIKRGALIVFSLASDIAKYFAIVPSFFDTALPELKALNLMNLHSTDSALLASLIWSAIAIIGVAPLVFLDNLNSENKSLLWRNIMLYGLSGMIIPFVGIKLIDMLIVAMHLV